MHIHPIEDDRGDLVDVVSFCSDFCHRAWCRANNKKYDGWYGCQEGGDGEEFCAHCGEKCWEGFESD